MHSISAAQHVAAATAAACLDMHALCVAHSAVLGRAVSTPAQRMHAQQVAEAALMQSRFAYWEHILLHWLWATVLGCLAQLLATCWAVAFWAVLLWRLLHGGGGAMRQAAAGKGQHPAGSRANLVRQWQQLNARVCTPLLSCARRAPWHTRLVCKVKL